MSPKLSLDQPAAYRITVQGALDAGWADYFENLRFNVSRAQDGSPITSLTGSLPDQAAVQGVLQKLYNLGFPLLSVERMD